MLKFIDASSLPSDTHNLLGEGPRHKIGLGVQNPLKGNHKLFVPVIIGLNKDCQIE